MTKVAVKQKRAVKPRQVSNQKIVRRAPARKKAVVVEPELDEEIIDVPLEVQVPVADAATAASAIAFDGGWYLQTYPDVQAAGVDPLEHFLENGVKEGRNPNPHFDGEAYLRANPDIADFPPGPFIHYVCYGFQEKRPLR